MVLLFWEAVGVCSGKAESWNTWRLWWRRVKIGGWDTVRACCQKNKLKKKRQEVVELLWGKKMKVKENQTTEKEFQFFFFFFYYFKCVMCPKHLISLNVICRQLYHRIIEINQLFPCPIGSLCVQEINLWNKSLQTLDRNEPALSFNMSRTRSLFLPCSIVPRLRVNQQWTSHRHVECELTLKHTELFVVVGPLALTCWRLPWIIFYKAHF